MTSIKYVKDTIKWAKSASDSCMGMLEDVNDEVRGVGDSWDWVGGIKYNQTFNHYTDIANAIDSEYDETMRIIEKRFKLDLDKLLNDCVIKLHDAREEYIRECKLLANECRCKLTETGSLDDCIIS
jgi:uncharacterized protein YukE